MGGLAVLARSLGHQVTGPTRIPAILEPRSNTMKMRINKHELTPALSRTDEVFLFQSVHLCWPVAEVIDECIQSAFGSADLDVLVVMVIKTVQPGDTILVMSNGHFGSIHKIAVWTGLVKNTGRRNNLKL